MTAMSNQTDSAGRAGEDSRAMQRRKAMRTALVLASVALVFFVGVMIKQYLLRHWQ